MSNPALVKGNKIGKQFSSEYQPKENGRAPGVKNRATIIKKVFEMQGLLPDVMFEKLKAIFPEITKRMTFEEIATIAQVAKAVEGDTQAYRATMDSAYGLPKAELELSGGIKIGKELSDEDYK